MRYYLFPRNPAQEQTVSIEQALAANTAALQQVADLLSKLTLATDKAPLEVSRPQPDAAAPAAEDAAAKAITKAKTSKAPAPTAAVPQADPETGEVPAPAAPAAAAQPAAVDYATLSKAMVSLVNAKGRDALIEVLASFGAKSGKELKAEQYADVLAQVEALKVAA